LIGGPPASIGVSVRARSFLIIVICQVAGLTLWFSASAAVPNLLLLGLIDGRQASLLTTAVQLGFVAGTLLIAAIGLSDRFDPRRVFCIAVLGGAAANALLVATGADGVAPIVLRFVTGMTLAGVYPVGMKLATGWAEGNVGLLVGTLVGALTLGSAAPHLFNALGGVDWTVTISAASVSATVAGLAINLAALGPRHQTAARFTPREALAGVLRRPVFLANAGYLGHMWELYAMWAWIGSFLAWGLAAAGQPSASEGLPYLLTFFVVAAGAVGSVVAGALADRFGRTLVTIVAMTISGSCAAVIGFTPSLGIAAMVVVALIWGLTIVADSAQFSAAIAELSPPRLIGTMLTLQTCAGFALTVVTIQLMPLAIALVGWRYAFMILAIGPFLGALAMWRLRREPEAIRIAGGRR